MTALLGEAISADIHVSLRMRYATPEQHEQRIAELEPVKANAKKCWEAAKHLYCEKKDKMDAFYANDPEVTASVDGKSSFEQMRKVVEAEMTQQLEKELLDSETKI
jgi:hypothetical protein